MTANYEHGGTWKKAVVSYFMVLSQHFLQILRKRVIALMMEAAKTSETLVKFYQTTRRYNPEDSHLRTHRRENLKSYQHGSVHFMKSCDSAMSLVFVILGDNDLPLFFHDLMILRESRF
jgi:hypothetical protein